MEVPESLEDDEYAEAVLDFVQADWLAKDALFEGWEEELVQKTHQLLGDELPEESDVWDVLDTMGITNDSSPFSEDLENDDNSDNHQAPTTYTYSKDNLF